MTGRQTLLPAGGRATFRSKTLVLLGTLLIVGSMLAIAAGRPGSVLAGPPASTISRLEIGTIGSQTAGVPFPVTVTAFGSNGSVKTSFTGPVTLSGLDASIGCSGCDPVVDPVGASYGSFTWNNGVGTASVTAVRATANDTLIATAGSVPAQASFGVVAGALGDLTFANGSFNGQPIDAELGYPINSECLPGSLTANPCGPDSIPTKVQAVDAYGNVKNDIPINITSDPSGVTGTLSGSTDANGEATFANLVIGVVGNPAGTGLKTLIATSGAATDTSDSFSVVNDLSACDGTECKNNTSNGKAANAGLQKAWGRITTGGDFFVAGSTNVRLTTEFSLGGTSGQCGSNVTIGDSTDLKISGLGTGDTAPSTTMVLVIPSDSLKFYGITSRGTPSFNVCLGALNVDPDSHATTWQQKNLGKKGGLKASTSTADDPDDRAWGVPADCGTTGLIASDPCIGLRTKSANQAQTYLGLTSAEFAQLGISENDLVIVIEKGAPWDGKGGVY